MRGGHNPRARAEVGGERPDVGAAPALDPQRREWILPRCEPLDLDPVDVHTSRRALDLLAPPGEIVEAAAVDLDRRHHRGDLVDVADECRRGALDLFPRDRHRPPIEDLTRRVERARGDAERDLAPVLLARFLEEAQEPRAAPEPDEQHAGRVGIERAGVADAPLPVDPAQLRHDVVRRPPRGLVDDDEAVDRPLGTRSTRPGRGFAQSAAWMRATTSGMASSDVKPAANR